MLQGIERPACASSPAMPGPRTIPSPPNASPAIQQCGPPVQWIQERQWKQWKFYMMINQPSLIPGNLQLTIEMCEIFIIQKSLF